MISTLCCTLVLWIAREKETKEKENEKEKGRTDTDRTEEASTTAGRHHTTKTTPKGVDHKNHGPRALKGCVRAKGETGEEIDRTRQATRRKTHKRKPG